MKLKNFEIEPLVNFLFTLSISGKPSRMRMRLIDKLNEKFIQYEKERLLIADTYAEKDNEGKSVLKEENGMQIIVLKDVETANREINELHNEYSIIEDNEENKDMLVSVKNVVLDKIDNDENEYFGREAANRNRFYEIFENIKY